MRRMIISETNVYSQKDHSSLIVKQLPVGKAIDLGTISLEFGTEWIEAFENARFIGYIDGNTAFLNIDKYYFITGDMLVSYEKPDVGSPVAGKYKRDEHIYPVEKIKVDGTVWLKVYDNKGNVCYIPENSSIKSCEFSAYNAYLSQKTVCVYTRPQKRNSRVMLTLVRGANVIVSKIVEDEYCNYWLEIIADGQVGYIPRSTQLLDGDQLPSTPIPPKDIGVDFKDLFMNRMIVSPVFWGYVIIAMSVIAVCIVMSILFNM